MSLQLTPDQVGIILKESLTYLCRRYSGDTFTCVHFVRKVFHSAGIELPVLSVDEPPPEFNIAKEDLASPPAGHLMFLRDKDDKRERAWTHIVIILPDNNCIHCSLLLGGRVTVTEMSKLFERYDFVPSRS